MFSFFSFSLMTLVTDKVSWHAGGWPTVSWSIFWKRLSQATVMKGTGPFWLALDFNWQHPGGFRDNQTLKFSFPGQVLAMCCALWKKIRRPPLQTQGSHDYQTRLTCENSSKKENSAQRKGDGGWLCKVGHHSGDACSQAGCATYISSPRRMFDVISGTTPGLNIAKIDLLV